VALRNAWYDAPDLAARKRLAEQIQLRFLETPFLPVGQYVQATAHRAEVADIVSAPQTVFWGAQDLIQR
jgi:peptide/nickel transport system substrate-binding protein